MCEHWGISYSLFSNRRALGHDLRQCLTGDGAGNRRHVQDDDEGVFDNMKKSLEDADAIQVN